MIHRLIKLGGVLLSINIQAAHADCIGRHPEQGSIDVCVVEPLFFGEVTSPRIGSGSFEVTPAGERNLGRHVNDFYQSDGHVSAAIVRVRGEPSRRFRLRLLPQSGTITSLKTDLGPANEGVFGPTGEAEVRIGATISLNLGDVGTVSEQFTVAAELLD